MNVTKIWYKARSITQEIQSLSTEELQRMAQRATLALKEDPQDPAATYLYEVTLQELGDRLTPDAFEETCLDLASHQEGARGVCPPRMLWGAAEG